MMDLADKPYLECQVRRGMGPRLACLPRFITCGFPFMSQFICRTCISYRFVNSFKCVCLAFILTIPMSMDFYILTSHNKTKCIRAKCPLWSGKLHSPCNCCTITRHLWQKSLSLHQTRLITNGKHLCTKTKQFGLPTRVKTIYVVNHLTPQLP